MLITGANGFIGQHLSVFLSNKKNICCSFVVHPEEKAYFTKLPFFLKTRPRIFFKDLAKDSLKPLGRFETIVHLAGSTKSEQKNHSSNVTIANNLCQSINPKKCRHIIFTSTMAVYDNSFKNNKVQDPYKIFNHIFELNQPLSNYSKSKHEAEKIFLEKTQKNKIKLSVIRLPTVFGDGCRKEGLFFKLAKLVSKNHFLSRINWPAKISFISVDALCAYIWFLINQESRKSQLVCPYTEHKTLYEVSRFFYKKYEIKIKTIKLKQSTFSFISKFLRYLLQVKSIPHALWNSFWQAFLVIENKMELNKVNKLKTRKRNNTSIKKWILNTNYLS